MAEANVIEADCAMFVAVVVVAAEAKAAPGR